MIEVCEDNIYYKRRCKNKKLKRLFTFLIFVIVITLLYFYSKYFVFGNVLNVCSDTVYSYSSKSVNECILDEMIDGITYNDIITIEKNSSGDITLITTDSVKVNYINRVIVLNTQERLEKRLEKGIPIPLFAFSGIKLLSGYGPKINFKSLTVSSVTCDFRDEFTSVGINQTMHTIYVDVKCVLAVEFPLNRKEQSSITSVMMSQSLIVGKIPNIYLNKV